MWKKLYVGLAVLIIIACSIALALQPAEAREFHVLELKEVSMGYKDFFDGAYDPFLNESGMADRQKDKQVNLFINMDVAKYFYWNNRIHGTTDEGTDGYGKGNGKGQFRMIGWNFQLGVRPFSRVKLEYEHHSQHMLDWDRKAKFPVEDSIGIKIEVYRSPEPSDSIF